jgi:hypothetical protein
MLNINRPTALAIGAVALIVGAISPWITVLGVIGAGPLNFIEVAIVVFASIGLVIASALTARFMRPVSIVVGIIVLSQVGYVWFHLSEADTTPLVQPGWGLFLSTAAALYLIASTWVAKKPVQQPV